MIVGLIQGPGKGRGEPGKWLAAASLLLSLAAGVLGAGPDPAISGIEITPSDVMVDASRAGTLELSALLWTGLPAARLSLSSSGTPPLVWTVSPGRPWLAVQRQDGNRVTLQITPQATQPAEAVVTVTAGAWSANTRLIPVTASDQDIVEAPRGGDSPSVVITNGVRDGACGVAFEAFVGAALLGQLVADCGGAGASWGAAILSVTHALVMLPGNWTPTSDTVRLASSPVPAPRLLPIMLWVVVGGPGDLPKLRDSVKATALASVAGANSVLAENRSGVELTVVDTVVVTTTVDRTVVADCLTGDGLVANHDRPGMMRVYYVNSMGNARGFTCAGTEDHPQSSIYVSTENEASSTLVHEVGHALGLTLPSQGHVDRPHGLETVFLNGFDASNVMTSGISDWDPAGRHRLSVGQVFRMNADSASWLNAATETNGSPAREATAPHMACQCGEADPTGYCPRLRDDVTRPGGGAGSSEPWDCHDLLRLPGSDPDEEPVGVLFGREWRAPIARCGNEVSEYRPDHWDASYLGFLNFTRPGNCPSWAAVFFRKHGLLYRPLIEGHDVAWSDAADEWGLDDAANPPPLSVPVHLYFASAQQVQVKADVAEATRVFGEDNRTGLSLAFDLHPSSNASESCPQSTSKGLYVCYFTASVAERELSHLIGAALDLQAVPPGDQDKAAFEGNVMQPAKDLRAGRLTLGQVFRINAFLRPGQLPDCALAPGACPSLDMDIAR